MDSGRCPLASGQQWSSYISALLFDMLPVIDAFGEKVNLNIYKNFNILKEKPQNR